MKKLKIKKAEELIVARQFSIECDFCGEPDKEVFTSEYSDRVDTEKINTQICVDCVKQLAKLLNN